MSRADFVLEILTRNSNQRGRLQSAGRLAKAAGLGQIGLLLRCVGDVLDSPFCSVGRVCDVLAGASYGVSASDSRQRSDEQCDCRQLPEFHRFGLPQ